MLPRSSTMLPWLIWHARPLSAFCEIIYWKVDYEVASLAGSAINGYTAAVCFNY
jgi:hypothetical protein